ncbi:FtsW Bacterial cell division membrane protein [Sphingomonadaceae bacterium]|jgi:cell division protein FtsW|uniref:FtsW/RodA/SpoVE family cell cycle protein n=1 Tax=Sphingorhabdus sp. TaxID=1902408 RepID=UPI00273E7696|nr:putative peptidoglycan glycosyltransferase FtsW [Sphingorhabdus sp.]MCF8498317.1 putative lipid II flippase FtsW [Sphingomonadaceae bacterium]MDP4757253.1 putative lipid II flippase FtsW [Sphingorhabdus sp.]MDP4872771.1 putative lipid II flippase FtsW [Sphingorhabdus sp.]MDP4927662.1 putative lipid II flippase FtsW [Sphingorhabdus sp.]
MSDGKDVPWVLAAKTGKIGFANRLGRGDRSPLGVWFWELDRVLLSLMMVLIAIGLLAVAAASPAGAQRLSASTSQLSSLYFFYRQLMWVIVGVPIMLFISMCPREKARRIAVYGFCIVFVLLVLVPVLGREVNGSRRWIGPSFAGLQPSEFLKPFYAVTMAWIISWRLKDPTLPVLFISSIVTAAVCIFLLMQPDLGQTILFMGTWFALMMVAGVPASRLWGLIVSGIIFIVLAYNYYPVATQRIDAWIFGTEGLTHDKMALATLINGGFIGLGPGLGVKKYSLPEGHTDYIFSVIGEEFGLLACMVIAILYFAILVRIIIRLLDEKDQFVVLAVTGLGAQFCGQAMINIAVNLGVFPSKGMTLPFISYGGSSIVALSMTCGLILALTKRNPYLDRSLYMVKGQRP